MSIALPSLPDLRRSSASIFLSPFALLETNPRLNNTDGSDFMGERLTVQFARGARHREGGMGHERAPPRPRRTPHRMQITGLPNDTSWQVCSLSQFVAPGFHGTCMPFSSYTWSALVCCALHWVGMCAPHYPSQPLRSGLATLAWHPWFLT